MLLVLVQVPGVYHTQEKKSSKIPWCQSKDKGNPSETPKTNVAMSHFMQNSIKEESLEGGAFNK